MWPFDLHLGPLVLNLYGLMVCIGIVAGLMLLRFSAPLAGLSYDRVFNLAFWLILAGLAGSRIAYVLNNLSSYIFRPSQALMYWQGGLMFQGGLAGGLILLFIFYFLGRLNLLMTGDALAPGLSLGQAIGRLGCLAAGCCYGRPAPPWFPLSISFPPGAIAPNGLPLYPTQAIESFGLFLLTALMMWRLKTKKFSKGSIMAMYLVGTGCLRLITEFFRGDRRGEPFWGLAPTSWAAVFILFGGLFLYWNIHLARKLAKPSSQT
ncbi:MAG: prolipoprotein diacylglyceryl transferase [Deltaproteobacteria bacterium]|jgi:phosphatidylglycerol:prolipoprotein diacylglycerol transferase|nr:prolipoprotein diacylglyceryl transferase [Deltaproteobacteria bacterium]